MINAQGLANATVDIETFASHLDHLEGQLVATDFDNLGGSSRLVVPAMACGNAAMYTHIAAFFRQAPPQQCDMQWRILGQAIASRALAHPMEPIWVNTEGSGVHWLHMRLDPKPKYYHYAPYRVPPVNK